MVRCRILRGSPAALTRIGVSPGGTVVSELGGSQISSLLESLPGIANVLRSPVADALVGVIRAASGAPEFDLADAEELIRYATRRGLMAQDEGDRLLEEVQAAAGPARPAAKPAPKAPPKAEPKPAAKPAAAKPAAAKPAAAKPAAPATASKPKPARAAKSGRAGKPAKSKAARPAPRKPVRTAKPSPSRSRKPKAVKKAARHGRKR